MIIVIICIVLFGLPSRQNSDKFTTIFRRLLQFCHKFCAINNKSGMLSLTDNTLLVAGNDCEGEFSALYGGKSSRCADLSTHCRRAKMCRGDCRANGGTTLLQIWCYTEHCCKYLQVTRAYATSTLFERNDTLRSISFSDIHSIKTKISIKIVIFTSMQRY